LIDINGMHFREGRVGFFGLRTGRDYWWKEYASEALGISSDFAFGELAMSRVGPEALLENQASFGVMVKNGFRTGDLVSRDLPNFGDTVMMRRVWLERTDCEVLK
jgi:RimJ/RimL family protein N-acetyltransferase